MSELGHILTFPILIPLVVGAVLILINERYHRLKFAVNMLSTLSLLVVSIVLLLITEQHTEVTSQVVYLAANWQAPFGIVLVADRLSAIMLVLTAVVANGALLFSFSRWADRKSTRLNSSHVRISY